MKIPWCVILSWWEGRLPRCSIHFLCGDLCFSCTLKMLFVTKLDIFSIPCKLRVEKQHGCTIVVYTIFRKLTNLRLLSPSSPIRYSILKFDYFISRTRGLALGSFISSKYIVCIWNLHHILYAFPLQDMFYKQRSSHRKCIGYLGNLPPHHDNVTHQGIFNSQPCYIMRISA